MEDLKKIKISIRSIFFFEELTKRMFEVKTNTDLYIYYYSCLLAGKEYDRTFDQFIDDCEQNPEGIKWFTSELARHNELNRQFEDTDGEDGGEAKKKSE